LPSGALLEWWKGGGKRGALAKNLAKLATALVYIHRIRNEPGVWNANERADIFSWPFLLAVAESDGGKLNMPNKMVPLVLDNGRATKVRENKRGKGCIDRSATRNQNALSQPDITTATEEARTAKRLPSIFNFRSRTHAC